MSYEITLLADPLLKDFGKSKNWGRISRFKIWPKRDGFTRKRRFRSKHGRFDIRSALVAGAALPILVRFVFALLSMQ